MSEPKDSPKSPERLVGLRFIESVPFAGEEQTTATLKTHDAMRGRVDTFTAIRFEADGRAIPVGANQRVDGFAIEREYLNRDTNKPARERVAVGLGNIRAFVYGPEAKP